MGMASSMKLSLKLVVDREKERVVCAESGGDFVDVLFSFLTLPLGTAVWVLGKRSGLGCVDELYRSVENLDVSCFQTAACKDMLLRPRRSSESRCQLLPVNVGDRDVTTFYTCRDNSCIETKYPGRYSAVKGAYCCGCLGPMDRGITWEIPNLEVGSGVFVQGPGRFTITDDLRVYPESASTTLSLFDKYGIKESSTLEHINVQLDREQVLTLLRKSLSSDAPLTEMFVQKPQSRTTNAHPKTTGERTLSDGGKLKARILKSKTRRKVLYAEVGEDVVNLFFSFLTLPLGSIIRLLEKSSHMGCMDNLYNSVEDMCATKYCAKLEQCKDMLLAPKIAPYFGCSNQLLEVDEMASMETTKNACACLRCAIIPAPVCIHGKMTVRAVEINPKLGNGGTEKGGRFAKGKPGMFMMTDDVVIMLNSSVSALQVFNDLKIPINDVEEEEVNLGQKEALDLLGALLLSRTPLTDVFCPRKEQKRRTRLKYVKVEPNDHLCF